MSDHPTTTRREKLEEIRLLRGELDVLYIELERTLSLEDLWPSLYDKFSDGSTPTIRSTWHGVQKPDILKMMITVRRIQELPNGEVQEEVREFPLADVPRCLVPKEFLEELDRKKGWKCKCSRRNFANTNHCHHCGRLRISQ